MITIAFDVDGCLFNTDLSINEDVRTLLILLSRMPNTRIIVWSGTGELYANMAVQTAGITKYVDRAVAKNDILRPDISFDDMDVTFGKVNIKVQ